MSTEVKQLSKTERMENAMKVKIDTLELKKDNENRREALLKLALIWTNYTKKVPELLESIQEIEKGVFSVTIKESTSTGIVATWANPLFIELYSDHLRRVLVNIDPDSHVANQDIKKFIDQEKFNQLATYSPQELAPSVWEPIYEEQRRKEAALLAAKEIAALKNKDSVIKCRKCHSHNIHVDTQQLRSADEGMTNILTCRDCGAVKKS